MGFKISVLRRFCEAWLYEDKKMDRAVYQYELSDPDFAWLLRTFQESNPDYYFATSPYQPVTLIRAERGTVAPALLVTSGDLDDFDDESCPDDFLPPKPGSSD